MNHESIEAERSPVRTEYEELLRRIFDAGDYYHPESIVHELIESVDVPPRGATRGIATVGATSAAVFEHLMPGTSWHVYL